jgi:hypothetical protein
MKRAFIAYYKEWFPAPSYTDNIKLEQDQYTHQLTAYRTQLDEFNLQCANPHTSFANSTN